jgi:hypothetical protein
MPEDFDPLAKDNIKTLSKLSETIEEFKDTFKEGYQTELPPIMQKMTGQQQKFI